MMDISSVGSFAVANKVKANDNDGDDKGGAKTSGKEVAQQVAAKNDQNTGNVKPAAPTTKSDQEDNVVQTKTPQASKQGRVDTVA